MTFFHIAARHHRSCAASGYPKPLTLLCENNMSSRGKRIELAHGQDFFNLVHKVVFLEPEHVDTGLAGIKLPPGRVDHLDEFIAGRNIKFVHFLIHHPGGHSRHAGYRADESRDAHSGVAHRGDLDLFHFLFRDSIQSEEGKKEVCLEPFHTGAVGHNQGRVDTLERTFGTDNRYFLNFFVSHNILLVIRSWWAWEARRCG